MASRGRAIAVVCLFALLAFFIKPLGMIAGGTITLVTLAINFNAAMLLAFTSSAVVGLAGFWLSESPINHVAIYLSVFVIPVVIAAILVRSEFSLSKAIIAIAGWTISLTFIAQLLFGNLDVFWKPKINELVELLQLQLTTQQVDMLALMFTPILGSGAFLLGLLGFFLGFHWKLALNEDKGLDKKEYFSTLFRNVHFGANTAIIMSIVLILAFFDNTLALNTSGIILAALLVQGIAIFHFLMHVRQINRMLFFIFYLLIFFVPEATILIVSLGLVDNWIDFRKRLTPKKIT